MIVLKMSSLSLRVPMQSGRSNLMAYPQLRGRHVAMTEEEHIVNFYA